jgi:hypothetical protein
MRTHMLRAFCSSGSNLCFLPTCVFMVVVAKDPTMSDNFCVTSVVFSMVQFVDSYDPPVKGLHDDLNFVSPRIGEVRAVTTIQLAELFYVLAPRILDFSLICIFLL